jgi:hypothetical protein
MMALRVISLCVLACGATATMDASPFGNSVLAELETKLAAGTPLDELTSILNDIRDRLKAADSADVAAQIADDQYCADRTKKLQTDITLEIDAISSLNQSINEDKAVVQRMEEEMARLQKVIEEKDAERIANELDQAERIIERGDQNTDWVKGKMDAKICLDAIDEIQNMPGLGLARSRQDDSAADYQAGVRLASMLESMAEKISHPQVQSFVQLAALTMATKMDGDFSQLEALLQQLEDELQQYILDIAADEAALLRQHLIAMEDLRITHEHLVSTIAQKRQEYSDASNKKDAAEDRITANTTEMLEAIASKEGLVAELTDLMTGCSDRKKAHGIRIQERIDEGATIDKIQNILETKLAKHFGEGGHLTANITSPQ